MRILALTNLYPNPFQPHRATFNRHRLRLIGETHPVRVIGPISWTDELAARRKGSPPLPKGRRHVFDNLTVEHPRYLFTPKMLRSQYGRFYYWSVRKAFLRAVSEFRPDVVYTPWAYPDGWASVHLARRAGLPIVIRVHGSDVMQLDDFRGRKEGTQFALCEADGVIAVSEDLARRVIALGARPERVRVIIDGIDTELFSPGNKAEAQARLGLRPNVRHLLFVGNLLRVKGIDVLLQACARLGGEHGDWQLNLVGEGALKGQLQQLAVNLKLGERVVFHGSTAQTLLPDWYRAADVFVLPSRSEGVPNVLLEAAACDTPWVASRVGGIPEIANLGASRLVDSENPAQLCEAVVKMLARPAAYQQRPRNRREAYAEAAEFIEQTWQGFGAGKEDANCEPLASHSASV